MLFDVEVVVLSVERYYGEFGKMQTAGLRSEGVITGKMRRKSVGIIVRGLGQLLAAKIRACAYGPYLS